MITMEMLAEDPMAPVSAQLTLAGSTSAPDQRVDLPSPVGLRPWGLRRARPAGPGSVLPAWRYDEQQQVAVEIATGMPLIVGAAPTAKTTSTVDGEDGPSSEDWNND